MAQVDTPAPQKIALPNDIPLPDDDSADVFALIKKWYLEEGYWYLVSAAVHAVGFVILALIAVNVGRRIRNDAPSFDPAEAPKKSDGKLEKFQLVGDTPLDPSELNTDTLTMFEAKPLAQQDAKYYDDSNVFEEAGGGKQMDKNAPNFGGLGGLAQVKNLPGPQLTGGGVGVGIGTGKELGAGGAGSGFGGRGKGHREAMAGVFGGTRATERAVGAALNWIGRHQLKSGNWSINHTAACQGKQCSGPGSVTADSAATGMALLPFLAAGQTHKSRGPYQNHISRGIYWLVQHQKASGDLSADAFQPMYSHAIATLAMCECYGMTGDEAVRNAAQRAVKFIQDAQNKTTGGWRYMPGDEGDTSVTGWQMMALKSAQMAKLTVDPPVMEKVKTWLKLVTRGEANGLYSYLPAQEYTPTTTAIGMLCQQYLGQARDDPAMVEGVTYLMKNQADPQRDRNAYYWYYATMVMHNYLGSEWDVWNRRMRRVLIESQSKGDKGDCSTGSWDPDAPSADSWGGHGGRLMLTSFGALTLEVYYRYLPLFKLDPAGEKYSAVAKQKTAEEKAAKPAEEKKPGDAK